MSLRRQKERYVFIATMEEEMRQLHATLDSMESTQRRAPYVEDVRDVESENTEEEKVIGEEEA
jgi:hypothetical protein